MHRLPGNIGQQRAVLAGLAQARGSRVVVMDADLQDPPEAIPVLLDALSGNVSAVFFGRRGRHQSIVRHLTSRLFKTLLHMACGTPPDAGLFVAMDRRMVTRLLPIGRPGPSVLAMMGCTRAAVDLDTSRTSVALPWTFGLQCWRRMSMGVRVARLGPRLEVVHALSPVSMPQPTKTSLVILGTSLFAPEVVDLANETGLLRREGVHRESRHRQDSTSVVGSHGGLD